MYVRYSIHKALLGVADGSAFTTTAILQLRDAGKLQLDDSISRHLAWFAVQNPYPDSPSITIRHLLTHTSGLPRESPFPYWTDAEFPSREQVREALSLQSAILPTEMKTVVV